MPRLWLIILLLGLHSLQAGEKSRVLESRETMIINDRLEAEYSVFQRIYVADERGKDLARFNIFTNEFVELKSAKAKIMDRKGKVTRKIRKRDLLEVEPSGYGILASGSVYHRIDMSRITPVPFTMEMEYTVILKSLFFWPDWAPQQSIPVAQASLDVITPTGFKYASFSPLGLAGNPSSGLHTHWGQSDLEPWPEESALPPEVFDKYTVFFSADTFNMGNYGGSGRSWQSLGQFYDDMSRDQYVLSPGSATDLKFTGAQTLRDSLARIYDYVQNTTRYVGIELGIHGWRPHSSQWVCNNKYGDCKDLTTFFITLLRRYHIKALPALIRTRDSGWIYPEFPSDRFNHVISCVFLGSDTLWVDCTVDDGRIDIIPAIDQGCNVLLVDGAASRLVQTPIGTPEQNSVGFDAQIQLDAAGAAVMKATLSYTGLASTEYRSHFQGATVKDQREYIIYLFDGSAPGLILDTFSVHNLDNKYAPLEIYLEAQVQHLATRTGNRLFLQLGLPYRLGWSGEHFSRRTSAMYARVPLLSTKSIRIFHPASLELEAVPADADITTVFGQIRRRTTVGEGNLEVDWRRTHEQTVIELGDYEAYYRFRQEAKQVSAAPVVFKQR